MHLSCNNIAQSIYRNINLHVLRSVIYLRLDWENHRIKYD